MDRGGSQPPPRVRRHSSSSRRRRAPPPRAPELPPGSRPRRSPPRRSPPEPRPLSHAKRARRPERRLGEPHTPVLGRAGPARRRLGLDGISPAPAAAGQTRGAALPPRARRGLCGSATAREMWKVHSSAEALGLKPRPATQERWREAVRAETIDLKWSHL